VTSGYSASSLAQPPQVAAAAHSLAGIAQAAARAWAEPLASARHRRVVSQLYFTLRDLATAARGFSRYRTEAPSTCKLCAPASPKSPHAWPRPSQCPHMATHPDAARKPAGTWKAGNEPPPVGADIYEAADHQMPGIAAGPQTVAGMVNPPGGAE
jgi:hypothetical protein